MLLNQNVFLTSIDLTCLRFLNIEKFFRNTKKFTQKVFCITKYLDSVLVNSISLHLISKLEADKNNDYRGFSRRPITVVRYLVWPTGTETVISIRLTVLPSFSPKSKC